MSDSTKSPGSPKGVSRVLAIGIAVWLGVLATVPISYWRGQGIRWFEILLPLSMVGWFWAMTVDPNQGGFVMSRRVAWLLTLAGGFMLFGRIWNLVV